MNITKMIIVKKNVTKMIKQFIDESHAFNFDEKKLNYSIYHLSHSHAIHDEYISDYNIHQYVRNYIYGLYRNLPSFLKDEQGDAKPLNEWDVSRVTDMSYLFAGLMMRYNIDDNEGYPWDYYNDTINDWNVSNVEDMEGMFFMCNSSFKSFDKWDTSKVKNMSYMFFGNQNFDDDLNMWNVSNVKNMDFMFYSCNKFNHPLNNWDVKNCSSFEGMFYDIHDGRQMIFSQNLSSWKINKDSNITNMFSLNMPKEYLPTIVTIKTTNTDTIENDTKIIISTSHGCIPCIENFETHELECQIVKVPENMKLIKITIAPNGCKLFGSVYTFKPFIKLIYNNIDNIINESTRNYTLNDINNQIKNKLVEILNVDIQYYHLKNDKYKIMHDTYKKNKLNKQLQQINDDIFMYDELLKERIMFLESIKYQGFKIYDENNLFNNKNYSRDVNKKEGFYNSLIELEKGKNINNSKDLFNDRIIQNGMQSICTSEILDIYSSEGVKTLIFFDFSCSSLVCKTKAICDTKKKRIIEESYEIATGGKTKKYNKKTKKSNKKYNKKYNKKTNKKSNKKYNKKTNKKSNKKTKKYNKKSNKKRIFQI